MAEAAAKGLLFGAISLLLFGYILFAQITLCAIAIAPTQMLMLDVMPSSARSSAAFTHASTTENHTDMKPTNRKSYQFYCRKKAQVHQEQGGIRAEHIRTPCKGFPCSSSDFSKLYLALDTQPSKRSSPPRGACGRIRLNAWAHALEMNMADIASAGIVNMADIASAGIVNMAVIANAGIVNMADIASAGIV
jgi:hypothetical protein